MSTTVCIDTRRGQDCLEFSEVKRSVGKRWQLTAIQSMKVKSEILWDPDPVGSGRMNLGHFYTSHSAYDLKI